MAEKKHFDKELLNLHQEIMKMGILVEQSIRKAMDALLNRDTGLAETIIKEDDEIDRMETAIEDRCIRLIAREQPFASDLRTLITTLKIVSHIERMGDHGVHLAKGVIRLGKEELIKPLIDIPRMGELIISMLPRVLAAFMNKDKELALAIAREDDQIDKLHTQVIRELLTYMMENPQNIRQATNLLFISRFLERLGDHVVDICEWVVYNTTGEHPDLNE